MAAGLTKQQKYNAGYTRLQSMKRKMEAQGFTRVAYKRGALLGYTPRGHLFLARIKWGSFSSGETFGLYEVAYPDEDPSWRGVGLGGIDKVIHLLNEYHPIG